MVVIRNILRNNNKKGSSLTVIQKSAAPENPVRASALAKTRTLAPAPCEVYRFIFFEICRTEYFRKLFPHAAENSRYEFYEYPRDYLKVIEHMLSPIVTASCMGIG